LGKPHREEQGEWDNPNWRRVQGYPRKPVFEDVDTPHGFGHRPNVSRPRIGRAGALPRRRTHSKHLAGRILPVETLDVRSRSIHTEQDYIMDQLTNQPTKRCSKCREDRDRSWFNRDWKRKDYRTAWCKPCLRAAARERRTGISQAEFDRLLADQSGRCGICRTPFATDSAVQDSAAVARIDRAADGRVRGLLCPRCKVGVSTFQDDVERLRAAVGYLDKCADPI